MEDYVDFLCYTRGLGASSTLFVRLFGYVWDAERYDAAEVLAGVRHEYDYVDHLDGTNPMPIVYFAICAGSKKVHIYMSMHIYR